MESKLSAAPAAVFGRTIAIAVSMALLLGACAPAAPAPPAPAATQAAPVARPTASPPTPAPTQVLPRSGGTLTVAAVADPPSFDTQQESTWYTSVLVAPAYNNLLYYDFATGSKVVPELAETWNVSSDGKTFTFKLRKGVTFHDGTPLTTEDVVFNLERMWKPPKGVISGVQPYMAAVDKIEATSNDTVTIGLKFPFAPLLAALVLDRMPMYSKAYVTKNGDLKTTIMGTGPFKFKSYTPSVKLELEKNDKYWVKGKPYLDDISFFIIKDKSTRLAALRTGRALLSGRTTTGGVGPVDMASLKKDAPGLRFVTSPSVSGPWFFMNLRKPPFKDLRVRKAVFLAVDRQAAIKVIGEGEGLIGSFFPFQDWGARPDALLKMPGYRQPKDQDFADAKKLLADAGYPNGFTLELLSRGNELTKNSAVFMTGQLAQIGITANVKVLEDAAFWDAGRKAQQEAMVYTPATVIADPFDMGRFFAPDNPLNFSGDDQDAKLVELWNKQMGTVDEAARKAIIASLDQYLMTDLLPAVPVVWPTGFIVIAAQVRGYVPGVSDYSNNRQQETWLAP